MSIDSHPAALEAWNRLNFDPPTPELELAPAETIQVEHPMTHAFPLGWAVVLGFALGVVLTLVGSAAI